MLAERRRGRRRPQVCRGEPVRRSGLQEATVSTGHQAVAQLHLFPLRNHFAVADRRARNPEGAGELLDLGDRALGEPRIDLRNQLGGAADQSIVLRPFGMSEHDVEVVALLLGAGGYADQAVLGCGHTRRDEAALLLLRLTEAVEERHRVVGRGQRRDLELREVGEATPPVPPAREQAHRGVRPAEPLAHLAADVDRCAVSGAAPDADDAARPCLQGELGGGAPSPRAGQPEGGDRSDGHVREVGFDPRGRQLGERRESRLGRPDDGVGARQHDVGRPDCRLGVVRVEDDAVLGAGEIGEERLVATVGWWALGGRPAAKGVTLGSLQLDHGGPGVGEQLGAVPACDAAREVHDRVPGQGIGAIGHELLLESDGLDARCVEARRKHMARHGVH